MRFISKDQNLRMPILEAVGTLNDYGLEVVSGIIVGLDTDTPQTADHIIEFVHASNIPVLTINILYALPKTPLWRRLEAEGRLLADETRESNVQLASERPAYPAQDREGEDDSHEDRRHPTRPSPLGGAHHGLKRNVSRTASASGINTARSQYKPATTSTDDRPTRVHVRSSAHDAR